MDILELKERLAELNSDAHDIRTQAEAEKRDLSVEETEKLDRILDSFDRVKADIDRLEKLTAQTELLKAPQGRKTAPDQPRKAKPEEDDEPEVLSTQRGRASRNTVYANVDTSPKNGGFRLGFGEYGIAVARACKNGGTMDPRLERLASATTYGNEGTGADGGFAVPPEFRTEIMTKILAEDSLLGRCDQITCSGNTFTQPIDETTPWQTSTGILAQWDGEAIAASQSKPALQERTVKLNKLRALVPVTEEILEDVSAMDSYLRKKAPEKIAFKVNLALIAGTGVGMPLGILNSPCKIAQAKTSGQVANSIVAANIQGMYNRMYGPYRQNAVWLYNQEVEPQLYKLSQPGTDNAGNAVTTWGLFMYMPPGQMSNSPYGTLMGRPCIPTQACSALSTEGDIIFASFNEYLALLKSGPNPRVDVSMHLWFDQDLTAFKFSLRMGGIPWLSTTISPLNGSNTYSPFVTLASR